MSNDYALQGLPGPVLHDEIVPARAPWMCDLLRGQTLRIIDLEGNQAVDFLIYNSRDDAERYSAQDTISAQQSVYLRLGSRLLSNEGRSMMTISETSVAYHDTLGGACSCESNTLRYGYHTKSQHACVDNFLECHSGVGRNKRDMTSNINFFMNVPIEQDGALGIVDGISAPGLHVTLRADMDVTVVASNCPQINNPCNGFNPTPVRMIVCA